APPAHLLPPGSGLVVWRLVSARRLVRGGYLAPGRMGIAPVRLCRAMTTSYANGASADRGPLPNCRLLPPLYGANGLVQERAQTAHVGPGETGDPCRRVGEVRRVRPHRHQGSVRSGPEFLPQLRPP